MAQRAQRKGTTMRLITSAIATVLSLVFTQLSAQDFNKGFVAYNAGDYATALQEWKPLAEQGKASAQLNLGIIYERGKDVLVDYAKAVKWYRLSAEQGNAQAQDNLGVMYYQGYGVIKDANEAVKWWRLSAEQGDASAQRNLGAIHANGNSLLQDNVIAYMWYNIASANGDKRASEYRDARATLMKPANIKSAIAMASKCMSSGYKRCGY